MAADCLICAAVAQGGRVRITEKSGELMMALFKSARRESVRARRAAIVADDAAQKQEADLAIREIERLHDEVERTMTEKGWRHGQLQRSDP